MPQPLTPPTAGHLPHGGPPAWLRSPWVLGGVGALGAVALALRARAKAGGDPVDGVPYRGAMSQYDSSGIDGLNNIQTQLAGQYDDFAGLLADYLGRDPAAGVAPTPSKVSSTPFRVSGLAGYYAFGPTGQLAVPVTTSTTQPKQMNTYTAPRLVAY